MAKKNVTTKAKKVRSPKPESKPSAPDHLTMNLFAPGMSAIHRAGLGGLACTLNALDRHFKSGLLSKNDLPSPYIDDEPPWKIDDQSITLRFGEPENAGEYLRKLFAFAFQIRDGLIYLPGQYGNVPPAFPVLAAIQEGIQNTFLQHGPTCGSRTGERSVTIEIDELQIVVTHDVFTSYKHQGWFWLDRDEKSAAKDLISGKKLKTGNRIKNHQNFPAVHEDGTLSSGLTEIDNKLLPGGMVRHDRFKQSAIGESSDRLICLHFAIVGCLTLAINRVTAALMIPELDDLISFSRYRPMITPANALQCRVANAVDATLQAQLRVYSRDVANRVEVPSCLAMTCKPTKWNEKQKPRVGALRVDCTSDKTLCRFERVYALLPPRLVPPIQDSEQKITKKAKKKREPFWSDSVVRPLIAENLALSRPWYAGFVRLMTKINPATDKPFRKQLSFEQKGLNAMISDPTMWDEEGEKLIVQAVHKAISMRYAQIAEENVGNSKAMQNRMERFRDKLRLDLAGSKTAAHVRFTLADLFSRGGNNSVLRTGWEKVLPVLRKDWQLARDLGLLALASYAGKGNQEKPDSTSINS